MGHQRIKNQGSAGVQLSLIVTPMLDMSFQILAFFIMTYHPSALEAHIPGNLAPPEKFAKNNPKEKKSDPLDDPLPSLDPEAINPELDAAITVKVRAVMKGTEEKRHPAGSPIQIFARTNLDTDFDLIADHIIILDKKDKEPVTQEETLWAKALQIMDGKLKEMGKGAGKTHIKLAPDGDLKQEYVMNLFDTCKRAGFSNVHFVPPPVVGSKINQKK